MAMNWKQFKDSVEALGVTDDDEINYIDVGYPHYYGSGESDMHVVVATEHDGDRTFHVSN